MIKAMERFLEWDGTKKDVALLVISGVALALSLAGVRVQIPGLAALSTATSGGAGSLAGAEGLAGGIASAGVGISASNSGLAGGIDPAWIAVLLAGIPIIMEAIIGLVTAFDIRADVLVSLALIASVIIGEVFAAGEVAVIMKLGSLLEELTVARARAGIENLVSLTPRTARRVDPATGAEAFISAEEVLVGDILRVLTGETIAVDGIITSGETSVDQAVMTGESLPVDKLPGDEVMSGSVNQFGAFDMRATKVGEDSSLQRMIRLVQSASADKAQIVELADRWATWIVVIALTAAGITWAVSGEIIRAVTILVVFCPCALVLATPTAIMAAIGNATKYGFLVKEGDALERLAAVTRITFDKTGTLTHGTPEVAAVVNASDAHTADEVLSLAASAELRSEHPLGHAIVRYCADTLHAAPAQPDSFQMLPGRGVSACVNAVDVLAGREKLLTGAGIGINQNLKEAADSYLAEGCTVTFVAAGGEAVGLIALSDTLREDAPATIRALHDIGVTAILLTGDHESAARHMAGELGIDEVHAEALPEDKLRLIAELQSEWQEVCMVGDGVNDAPALKKAYVGIAMGGIGSDIAVDAADIALVNDNVGEIPHLLRLARRMMRTIRMNLTFSMTLNVVAIILAITGILNPVIGALVHNAGSVMVIINSAFLLNWRGKI